MRKSKSKAPEKEGVVLKRIEKSAKEKKAFFMAGCNADLDLKDFNQKKRIVLYALKLCKGNITNACKMVNLSRKQFHNYKNDDVNFAEAVDDIKTTVLDHVVDKLHSRIDAGSDTAIIYYLNCQGKADGWGNAVAIDHTTKGESMHKALKNMTDDELQAKLNELNEKMK